MHPNALEPAAYVSQLAEASLRLIPHLSAGEKLGRRIVNQAMEEATGCTSASGVWSQRDSFQMLEMAVFCWLAGQSISSSADQALPLLHNLEASLPTQTVRSEEQVEHQHFSTPLGLAWLSTHLADIQPDDVVLEPSAGTGMLALWGRHAASLHLNESDPVRQEILRHLFPDATVTDHDAARIGAHLTQRPSVVLMNPPFARNAAGLGDPTTAARHLAAALGVLTSDGRLVAIMPDSFQPHGRRAELFQRALQGASVAFHARLEGAFAKQGTAIAVRLLVIDKRAGSINTIAINRATVADLVPFLSKVPPRRRVATELALVDAPPVSSAKTTSTLLGGFCSAVPKLAPVASRGDATGAIPLAYTLRDTIADAEQAVGVYVAYRPQRLIFENAANHPTQLVESAAMASVALPAPNYVPQLPAKVVRDRVLSRAQLETLVHALDATSFDLPGRYRVPERGLELVPDAGGAIYRRGFFLGDGTGAGKGRQLASILMDQWLRGNRRHLWISESNALIEDARRDWQALGGIALDIQPLSKIKPEARIRQADGLIFASYATLRSGTGEKTRLQQLLEWLTPDFDGVILFDEAHAMGGVAGGEGRFGATKGSQQGIVGVELQNRLPRARVIYASATGASDVNNLAYAVRLGLWGEGTAFPDRTSFIARIREGGIAAMELVARELKAMGVYTARALSYAGVEYDILEHALTPRQIADFDAYADAWAIIHRNLEAALGASGVTDPLEGKTLNGQALSAARSRFESSKQRFFGQLLLSMKLPSLLPAIEEALATEHSVVIQLVSTAEALLDRRLADLSAEDRAEIQLDLSPREIVADYLDNAFPTRAMESYWDEDGNERSRPMVDEAGNPVHSQEALWIKAETLELLGALPPIVPALDAIIARFGTDAVAEITGRTRRLVTLPDGSQRLESRTANQSLADANAFMGGAKRILVFSDAGGTGRSYHASLDAKNQQRRMHFLLEPGWRADRAIQGLGRTNRTHQASAPVFRPVTTDCRGERRFISTIARRLDALGA
ncbi:MAG: strawberry notch family protein, partial [Sphingomonadales bacterium]|nr:strawberry notch family protein [Sphingomonadales bacterium]